MSERLSQIQHYNPTFDLIRGLASLAVFFSHWKIILLSLAGFESEADYHYAIFEPFGILGVEFFFALSGLLLGPILYRQFQKKNMGQSLWIFLQRRWYRTLPTYYLGFLLFAVIFWVQDIEIPENWYLYLVFFQNFTEFDSYFYNVSWSLSVEEIFYVVFPALTLLVWCFSKNIKTVFTVACLFIILVCFAMRILNMNDFDSWDNEIRKAFLMRLDAIAVGVLVAIYCKNITWKICAVAIGFIILHALYIVFYLYHLDHNWIHILSLHAIFLLSPLCCALVIQYLANNITIKSSRLVTFFADISYPLYIFHLAFLYLFFPEGSYPTPEMFVLYIWFCIGFSYFVFKCVETPILKRRPQYFKDE